MKKAKKEVNILEELKNKFKKDTKCKNSFINFITDYNLTVNNNKYLLIFLDKMDMDLSDYLLENQKKIINLEIAKKIMLQVTKSIQCLHKIGIVYNDLKPDNVLINKKNTVSKLTDFNCILKLEEENYNDIDKDYTGCSTGSYRSPEQIVDAVSYDIKADSWQLGILFMCILQKNPRSFVSILAKKYNTDRDDIINGLNENIIDREIEKCKTEFIELNNKKEYNNLKVLIQNLLTHIPEKRITIEEIINSPFLKEINNKKTNTIVRN